MLNLDQHSMVYAMKSVLVLLLLLLQTCLIGQDFQGKALYRFNNSYADEDWSKKKLSESETKMWKSKLSEASRTTYDLRFNLNESSWAEVESLNVQGDKKEAWWNEAKNGTLYKDLANLNYELETEVFDKPFLVKDKLELPQWELRDETKQIGSYQVQKAVLKIEKKVLAFGQEEPQIVFDEIVAWFCPQIPVAHGPKLFWGLPGLILEIQEGSLTYICEKIELNSREEIRINRPKKGQEVSKKELDQIVEEKTEEILRKYNKGGKKGN